ncbi:MAG: hypothetical protein WCW25_04460 [Patescibacteria group bacterium]|jgi:hypothetical protein
MTRRYKLVSYTLIVGFLVVISAVVLTSQDSFKGPESVVPAVSYEKLTADVYKEKARAALAGYSAIAAKENFTADDIRTIKDVFLAIKGMPGEYKDIHVRLVMALIQIEDSLISGNQKALEEGQNKINEAKAANIWLE